MATFYIDPTAASGGDGSIETPFDSWADVTWTAGNTYLQKRGTTFITAVGSGGRIAPSTSGTVNARITIGAYGDGDQKPTIYNRADTGFNLDRRSYITLQNFIIDCTEATAAGIGGGGDTAAESVGIIIEDNEVFGGTLVTGISMLTQKDRLLTRNCIVRRNYVHDCGYHGILVAGSHVNTLVQQNRVKNVGFGVGAHGLSSFAHRQFIARTWSLVSGNVYKATIGTQSFLTTVIDIYGVSYAATGRTLARAAVETAPDANEYGFTGGELYINVGVEPTGVVGIGYTSVTATFEDNVVEDVVDFDGAEGTGIQLDDFSSGCIIRNNKIKNCQGFGVNINYGRSNVVTANLITGCDKTALRLGTNGAELNEAYGNTAVASSVSAAGEGISLGRNNTARNNAVSGYATCVAGLSDSTESHNVRDGGADVSGGISAGTGSVEVADLLLSDSYRPMTDSPLTAVGTHLGYTTDRDGRQRNNPPTIGAYEGPVTRTAATARSAATARDERT